MQKFKKEHPLKKYDVNTKSFVSNEMDEEQPLIQQAFQSDDVRIKRHILLIILYILRYQRMVKRKFSTLGRKRLFDSLKAKKIIKQERFGLIRNLQRNSLLMW